MNIESARNLDSTRPGWLNSLIRYFRKRRFLFLRSLIDQVPRPLTILDVGGSQYFWRTANFCAEKGVSITLVNIEPEELQGLPYGNIFGVLGDACDLHQFADRQFDIAMSNSVIEHVGTYADQQRMAAEIQRVAKRYFVQTPNRYFPVEPHVFVPFFQFLPFKVKVWILSHVRTIWGKESREGAMQTANAIRLLSKKELVDLFPGCTIAQEKLLGLTKSFMAYAGWDRSVGSGR